MIYLIALISALSGFLFGFDEGVMSGVLPEIREYFAMDAAETGFMMGLLPFGALFSSCVIGRFADWAGRLRILLSVPILFTIAILMIILSSSYSTLCFARILLGVSIGMSVVISPLYIAEAAPREIRGKLVVYFQLAITLGIFCAYLMNLFVVGHISWRWMFIFGLIPSTILFIGALFLPESPRWLCAHGKKQAARKSLVRLYGEGHNPRKVDEELTEIIESIAQENKGSMWKELFSKKIRPCLLLGMLLFFLQQLSGINAVIYYAPTIFSHMHLGSEFATLLATLGLGGVNVLMTLVAMRWIEKLGRRPLLIIGFIGTAVSLILVAILVSLDLESLGWLSTLLMFAYIAAFAVGLGPLPWVMMPEIFPLDVRGQGASFSAASNWAFNALVVATFPIFLHSIGIAWTFMFYGAFCILGLLYALRYVPETKGLSLEKIEQHIHSGKPLRKLGMKR